jgi:hypothetical protein
MAFVRAARTCGLYCNRIRSFAEVDAVLNSAASFAIGSLRDLKGSVAG